MLRTMIKKSVFLVTLGCILAASQGITAADNTPTRSGWMNRLAGFLCMRSKYEPSVSSSSVVPSAPSSPATPAWQASPEAQALTNEPRAPQLRLVYSAEEEEKEPERRTLPAPALAATPEQPAEQVWESQPILYLGVNQRNELTPYWEYPDGTQVPVHDDNRVFVIPRLTYLTGVLNQHFPAADNKQRNS